jgi:AraC-like DNA-binding protein
MRHEINIVTGEITEHPDAPATPQPPQIPQVVSRFQARAALHLAGLLDDVEAMMALPETPALAKLAWADAQEFKRNSPTVLAMSSALGMTEAQLDDLFTAAAGIEA